jgi:ElaB/YqjD/DUF883 family membrane-anchored ribosome-binding protein
MESPRPRLLGYNPEYSVYTGYRVPTAPYGEGGLLSYNTGSDFTKGDEMNYDEIVEEINRLKEEAELKLSLGKAEARDELEELEKRFEELKQKSAKIGSVIGDTAEEMKVAAEMGFDANSKEELGTALDLAWEELKSGFEKIRKIV